MSTTIRGVTAADIAPMAKLLLRDATLRLAQDPDLWALAGDARQQAAQAVEFALTADRRPFRQAWFVAERGRGLAGLVHSIRLPVPPIYAGAWGEPGLIMPDCAVSEEADEATVAALIAAAEANLREDGARVLLAAHTGDPTWRGAFEDRGYAPLTLYLSKSGLGAAEGFAECREAAEADIADIVDLGAAHRRVLFDLDAFWEPHPQADARFGKWMATSLTLDDRDMIVAAPSRGITGYIIAQPASRLHFPAVHDIAGIGVIDDFYHGDFADPAQLAGAGRGASGLLAAAEAALFRRGRDTVLVVCPAAWRSKVSLLETAGYRTAMTWMIRR